jgi:hypothetical protein
VTVERRAQPTWIGRAALLEDTRASKYCTIHLFTIVLLARGLRREDGKLRSIVQNFFPELYYWTHSSDSLEPGCQYRKTVQAKPSLNYNQF